MINITELHALAPSQLADILALMKELSQKIDVTPGMIESVLKAPGSHLFAAVDAIGANAAAKSPGTPTPGTPTPGNSTSGTPTPGTPAPGDSTPGSSTPGTPTPGNSTSGSVTFTPTSASSSPRILGVATLCVYESPTGRKASVEDVVVSQACRGQHIGKRLMEHIITYARTNLADVDLCLTSRPHRVAANNLYKSLGFQPKETNVYKMPIKR